MYACIAVFKGFLKESRKKFPEKKSPKFTLASLQSLLMYKYTSKTETKKYDGVTSTQ